MFLSRKQLTILIVVLSLLITAAVATTIWAVFFRGQGTPPISPDYPPQSTEQSQKPLEGDDGEKMESPEGGGAINVT